MVGGKDNTGLQKQRQYKRYGRPIGNLCYSSKIFEQTSPIANFRNTSKGTNRPIQ
jgi:hypothetical protein